MPNYAYHPDTGEFINTSSPAPWMGTTTTAPPTFNPASAGCFWRNGAWVVVQATVPTAAQLLVAAQNAANAVIDAQAGTTRTKYITSAPGQDATYQSKATDAAAYKAAGYPSASIANYPWVQAESKAINGATPTAAQYQAAADGIIATQAQWAVIGSSIEQQRRAGKIAVAAAATPALVTVAQAAAITALQAL